MMKVCLIIANWLFSFILLTYNGDSLMLVFFVVVYFSVACLLLNKYSRQVNEVLNRMNDRIDRILSGR